MVFSAPLFIFFFLPASFVIYFLTPKYFKNLVLVLLSCTFYALGEGRFIFFILSLVLANYLCGLKIQQARNKYRAKFFLALAIILNLGALFYFKYTNFFLINLSLLIQGINVTPGKVYLPLALSFFTFHAISYNFDIFRKKSPAEKNPLKLTLYLLFFPHLVAGPIIRYHQIADQLNVIKRKINLEDLSYGISRFISGLAKKVLIADTLAPIVDEIFFIPPNHLSTAEAWLGIICFTMQIYFDFSGYSDMAIGIARIFGFHFPENFNYPYLSKSIREFWTRWHITLSNWFKDYLYIPLGGSRVSNTKTYFNLWLVFLLCGLWHGASWTFIIWGSIHGLFLVMERFRDGLLINWLWNPLKHLYALVVVVISWVFFRSPSLNFALSYLQTMFGQNQSDFIYRQFDFFFRHDVALALFSGTLISLGLLPLGQKFLAKTFTSWPSFSTIIGYGGRTIILSLLLILSMIVIASQTFISFIYFRF